MVGIVVTGIYSRRAQPHEWFIQLFVALHIFFNLTALIISLNDTNQLVFVAEVQCVLFVPGIELCK